MCDKLSGYSTSEDDADVTTFLGAVTLLVVRYQTLMLQLSQDVLASAPGLTRIEQ